MRIGKSDLVKAVQCQLDADGINISARAADAAVSALVTFIANSVDLGNSVVLQGFGTFEPRHRAAREGRNPRTGEPVQIAASTVMGFRPAKTKG